MVGYTIQPIHDDDRPWLAQFAARQWGSDVMVMHGITVRISQQEGFLACAEDTIVGLITYRMEGKACEITSLDSLRESQGIGSALIEAVLQTARQAGCRRLFLVTTNDNLHALRFYQRRAFVLCALRPGAVTEARRIKPEIPEIGYNDIPIRDEIELEIDLRPSMG